jgi:hypothetical protein
MDSKTKVLLYLERNTQMKMHVSSKTKAEKCINIDIPNSRESSVGSSRPHQRYRTPSPSTSKKSQQKDEFLLKISDLISNLDYCNQKRHQNLLEYNKQENRILKFFEKALRDQKKSTKIPPKIQDIDKNPIFLKLAEKIAENENLCEQYKKKNKVMKTLLAQITLSQIDAKINNGNLHRVNRIENLTAVSFIKKYSSSNEIIENDFFRELLTAKPLDTQNNYNKTIEDLVLPWISSYEKNYSDLINIICTKIISEEQSRLLSEEAVDNSIAEKEEIMVTLEKKIQTLTKKIPKQNPK